MPVDHCLARGLQVADAFGFNEELVGKGCGTENTPGSAIIVKLLGEDIAAFSHDVLELLVCVFRLLILFCHKGIHLIACKVTKFLRVYGRKHVFFAAPRCNGANVISLPACDG